MPLSDAPACVDSSADRRPTPIHDRLDRANHLHAVAQARQDGQSQRAAVSGAGVARSTLRHWNAPPAIAAPAALAAFVETPEGVVWLRRILVAAHWSIGEQGGAGVRVVCDFLERSGLSAFIGASYGAQQAFQTDLEEQIVTAATELRGTLAQAMPHRTLSIAEDETWKDGMRLVGSDAVSNFILLEHRSDARSAAAWTQALEDALEGLNVTVVQGTGDEAKGLLAHVERDLDAHHSTDLFHLQHAVSQAMSLSLKRAEQQAETAEAEAKARWQEECAAEQAYHRRRHGPGRPPAFAARIDEAPSASVQASLAREQAHAHRAEPRHRLRALRAQRLAPLQQPSHPIQSLDLQTRHHHWIRCLTCFRHVT